jgi:hypothetical protein
MGKQEIKNLLNQLNLKEDFCSKEIIPIIKKLKSNTNPHIKLYRTICDACVENDNFQWYLLEEILELNSKRNLPCYNCKTEGCNVEGCIISLLIKKYDNAHDSEHTCFTKINKVEIIYF